MKTSRALPFGGFSLVEIVVALGVVSIVLVAILGLLSVGINSGKSSLDESLIAVMSRQVIGNLRQQQFSSNSLFENITTTGTSKIQTAFFDANGTRLLDSDGIHDINRTQALNHQAVYQCTVMAQSVTMSTDDPDGLGPAPRLAGTLPCLLDVNLTFTWPLQAKTPNCFSIRTGLARYY